MLQVLTCKANKTAAAHPRTDGLDKLWKLTAEDGTIGAIHVWSARNLVASQNAMGSWEDSQRLRGMLSNRAFGVASASSKSSFEASGLSVDAAEAVLLVTGKLTGDSDAALESDKVSEASDKVPGFVGRILLQGFQGGTVGAVSLFKDAQAMDEFLASEAWALAKAETAWEGLSVERFTVVDDRPAVSASA